MLPRGMRTVGPKESRGIGVGGVVGFAVCEGFVGGGSGDGDGFGGVAGFVEDVDGFFDLVLRHDAGVVDVEGFGVCCAHVLGPMEALRDLLVGVSN